ncbi:PAQR family membrane homeostasis protein TrhA [Actinopolymorpha pittospori]|uniref:Hemolysin III n=1 Tax=Actinopolymorpha pittospori TaxID=648752 RepID=A0A927RKL6_9ACTN|nr:hemolysin III family protein [Actinopolymorpha pittospori]MBE1606858.1 hemolysin III [Actinopolymorpha pittospori]
MHVPDLGGTVHDVAQTVKPKLRGWLHAGTFPLSVAAGIVIVVLAPTTEARIATAIFALTASLLFGVSALYHRGRWTPRAAGVLRRLDHANIFLIIAGTYTPFTLLLLDRRDAQVLLTIVWVGALLGVAFRVLWLGAPRWLYVPVYVAVGWAAAFWLPAFFSRGSTAVFVLILAGGLLYSAGAIVYATKKPNPSPRWFGFHEIFHAFTVAAFVAHYVGISLAVYS